MPDLQTFYIVLMVLPVSLKETLKHLPLFIDQKLELQGMSILRKLALKLLGSLKQNK